MQSIEFTATFGHQAKEVKIISNHSGGGTYQILIDNYYCGDMYFRDNRWQMYTNNHRLTAEDITILGEIIDRS